MIKFLNRFTCSEKQLRNVINVLSNKNTYPILDYINEDGNKHYNNFKKIINVIEKYPNNYFSIKLSSLNVHNNFELARNYTNIISQNAIENNSKILIDAENYLIQDRINDITDEMIQLYNTKDTTIYKTYQCYRQDCFQTIKADFANKSNYYIGAKIVRGAYYNTDYKYDILYDTIEDTHSNYNSIVDYLIEKCNDKDRIMIATHNDHSVHRILNTDIKNHDMIEFAQLMGMNNRLTHEISNNYNYKTFKYIPFGEFHESMPYLLRRLYENTDIIKYLLKL